MVSSADTVVGQSSGDDETSVMTTSPLVSVVINNYNYGRYLGAAIDSALNQSYSPREIIVVDDGSSDNSRDVIASYGERVIPVLKENGGQASAFNAGFARSRGDIVIFLDSDDTLLTDTAAKVVKAFLDNPVVSKVQYRLEVVDSEGQPMHQYLPAEQLSLPSGDLRRETLSFPDDIRTPPTSGNAFAAATLRRILPMPEMAYGAVGADLYLYNLAPLFGTVISLPDAGGRYRVHGSNHYFEPDVSVRQMRDIISRSAISHKYIALYAHKLKLPRAPRSSDDILSVTFIVNRLASRRLDPAGHPVAGDSIAKLMWLGIKASSRRFDLPRRTRLLYMGWFVAAALAPRPITTWLVTQVFFPARRGALGRFARS